MIVLNKELGQTLVDNEELQELIDDSDFLQALISAGVDNWSGYDFAQELYEEMKEENKNGN